MSDLNTLNTGHHLVFDVGWDGDGAAIDGAVVLELRWDSRCSTKRTEPHNKLEAQAAPGYRLSLVSSEP